MSPMLVLALDTSSPAGSLAVLRDRKVIGSIAESSDEPYSSRLFRQLDALLGDLSLELSQFDLFAACSGPGSFTGLRVGLTAAKAWSEICQKPIAAISALEAVAVQAAAPDSRRDALLVPVLDARRGQVYFGAFRLPASDAKAAACMLDREAEDCVAPPDEFLSFLTTLGPCGGITIVTPVPDVIAPIELAIRDLNISVESVSPFLAPFVGGLGIARAQRGLLTDSLSLDANYVRRSDAELHWKGA